MTARFEPRDVGPGVRTLRETDEAVPMKAVFLSSLDARRSLRHPLLIVIEDHGSEFVASWDECEIFGSGDTEAEAISELKREIFTLWHDLTHSPDTSLGTRTRRWKRLLSELVVNASAASPAACEKADDGLPNCYCGCGRTSEDDALPVPSESSIAARLTLAENDLTDLSRLFVQLEAVVLRGGRNGYCRSEPDANPSATSAVGAQAEENISFGSNIRCASCGTRYNGAVYRCNPNAFRDLLFAGFEWRSASCPSPSCNQKPFYSVAEGQPEPDAGVTGSDLPHHAPAAGAHETPIPDADAVEKDVSTAVAFNTLQNALRLDPDYAWGWHREIVTAAIRAGTNRRKAKEVARRFMLLKFGVETKEPGSKK